MVNAADARLHIVQMGCGS